MTRDYSQPHPDAIFKDRPTSFIEVWRNKTNTYVGVDFYIGSLELVLHNTIKHGHKTIALFLIKPKNHDKQNIPCPSPRRPD